MPYLQHPFLKTVAQTRSFLYKVARVFPEWNQSWYLGPSWLYRDWCPSQRQLRVRWIYWKLTAFDSISSKTQQSLLDRNKPMIRSHKEGSSITLHARSCHPRSPQGLALAMAWKSRDPGYSQGHGECPSASDGPYFHRQFGNLSASSPSRLEDCPQHHFPEII